MSGPGFGLDLQDVERQLDDDLEGNVVLGVLDHTTPAEEWVAEIKRGNVLVLAIEGDLNELAAGFARSVKELDGQLVHFRTFLIVAPESIAIDRDRL